MTALITAGAAVAAVFYTGRSLEVTGQQVGIAQKQNDVAQQGQYTDRYGKAIEQLDKAGPDHLQGRLGGVYALERLARDSPPDQPTIIEILSAFIRTNTPVPMPPNSPDPGTSSSIQATTCPDVPVSPDVRAALTVLGRRATEYDNNTPVDLDGVCFRNAQFDDAHLSGMHLTRANLRGANLTSADLGGAILRGADLGGALLDGADLSGANLTGADLSGAFFSYANFSGAYFGDTKLNNAFFSYANFSGAELDGADLSGAYLSAAILDGADLGNANLSGAELNGAHLKGADLRSADLSDADLRGADLSGALHEGTVYVGSKRNEETVGAWW